MRSKQNYDFMEKLAPRSVEEYEEMISKYPVSAEMAERSTVPYDDSAVVVDEGVEVIGNVKWYRRRSLSIAASLVLAAGVIGVGAANISRSSNSGSEPAYSGASETSVSPAESLLMPYKEAMDEFNLTHGTNFRFMTDEQFALYDIDRQTYYDSMAKAYKKMTVEEFTETLESSYKASLVGEISVNMPALEPPKVPTEYEVNSKGQTYGVNATAYYTGKFPVLERVLGVNFIEGYIYIAEGFGEEPSSPEEAIKWQEEHEGKILTINVYDCEGETILDTFEIEGGIRFFGKLPNYD